MSSQRLIGLIMMVVSIAVIIAVAVLMRVK